MGILKPGQTMCLSLLLFDSCLLWNIALYLADWLNYKFIQPSNQETIKQIVPSFQHQDYPRLSGGKICMYKDQTGNYFVKTLACYVSN